MSLTRRTGSYPWTWRRWWFWVTWERRALLIKDSVEQAAYCSAGADGLAPVLSPSCASRPPGALLPLCHHGRRHQVVPTEHPGLDWIYHTLRPLPKDLSFTHGLQQHPPKATPSELLLLPVSVLVKGSAVMRRKCSSLLVSRCSGSGTGLASPSSCETQPTIQGLHGLDPCPPCAQGGDD